MLLFAESQQAESLWKDLCSDTSGVTNILRVIGWAILIFKVAVPFIIIFFGMLDFGKAVTAEKPDEIKASAKRLLYRAIAGVIIFFVPAIVLWLFNTLVGFSSKSEDGESDFQGCYSCLLKPGSSECTSNLKDVGIGDENGVG